MEGQLVGDDAPPDAKVLHFADGIPGFAQARRFALSDLTPDGTFQELTCVDVEGLGMIVASPWRFFPDYAPELPESDRRVLDLDDPDQATLFCAIRVDDERDGLVCNLRAPFVANASTLDARQVILDEDLPLRAKVPAGA